jgi:hypothetical protein
MTVHLQSPARFFGQFFSFIFNPAQAVAMVDLDKPYVSMYFALIKP